MKRIFVALLTTVTVAVTATSAFALEEHRSEGFYGAFGNKSYAEDQAELFRKFGNG